MFLVAEWEENKEVGSEEDNIKWVEEKGGHRKDNKPEKKKLMNSWR